MRYITLHVLTYLLTQLLILADSNKTLC